MGKLEGLLLDHILFPTKILDSLHLFTPAEFKVLACLIRRTYRTDPIEDSENSISTLQSLTGLNRKTVINAVQGLLIKKQLTLLEEGCRGVRRFIVNNRRPEERESEDA